MRKSIAFIFIAACCVMSQFAHAQMPDDGFTMSKGELCLVAAYQQTKWTEYWEGTRLRDNKNLGTFTSKAIMPMFGYGITNRINVFGGLPYIYNSSSTGTMQGKKGWQDLSLAVKYHALKKTKGKYTWNVFATAGFSIPVSDYPPDFLPFSIGLGSKTAQLRVIGHVKHTSNFFLTAQTGYVFRSNIKVDRQTYYTDAQYYSNEMAIPNVWNGSLSAGYDNKHFRADVHYGWNNATSGSDMRRNDMPYPGNRMEMSAIGITAKFWMPFVDGLAINAGADQVVSGRNAGKGFTWMAGLQFVFKPFNKKTHEK